MTRPFGFGQDAKASLGDQRIAIQVKRAERRLRPQDRMDLLQEIHAQLLASLGKDYLAEIGAGGPDAIDELTRCVGRVCKRLQRAKRHLSTDQLEKSHNFVPTDPASARGDSIVRKVSLTALVIESLGPEEKLVMDALREGKSHKQINMGRTKFSQLKKKVFNLIASQLVDDL